MTDFSTPFKKIHYDHSFLTTLEGSFRILSLLAAISLTLLGLIVYHLGYQTTLDYVIRMGYSGFSEKVHHIISERVYVQMEILLAIFIAGCWAIVFYRKYIFRLLVWLAMKTTATIRSIFSIALNRYLMLLLIIPVISSIYWAVTLPVSYDEAWTFINFTTKGIGSSMLYYPAPNNHILHSVLTNITYHIPWIDPLFSIRLPSILVNALTWMIAYVFLRRNFNANFAITVVAISSMMFFSVYYSYMSRGYALVVLCFIVALYASFNIIRDRHSYINWIWFSLASMSGFYAMPSFLYPFLTLSVLILVFNRKHLDLQVLAKIIIVACVIILYLPVVLVNGVGALADNPYVHPIERWKVVRELPHFMYKMIDQVTGMPPVIILLLLIVSIIMLMVHWKKKHAILFALLLLSPPLLLIAHSVIPYSRTFVYYTFIIVFLVFLPFHRQLLALNKNVLVVFLVVIQLALLLNFKYRIKTYEGVSIEAKEVVDHLMENKKYLCNDELFDTYLIFELMTHNYSDAKVGYAHMVDMNVDTVLNYDYVIIDKHVDRTQDRKPVMQAAKYNVYKLRK